MEMPGFALNLDLSLYFEDLRKFASIYVDSKKCKEVGDVENHIKSVFKIDDNICLTNKRFLIPRSETILILQHYETLKVQKCDFYDYQIHKNKKSNSPTDDPALNLVQSDRTIDLSCRPKQRLKINICQNHCVLESPRTSFENARHKNTTQPPAISDENVLNGISEIHNKNKEKAKKKRYDLHKNEDEVNNDETTIKILDMSVNKLRKKNNADNFLTEEEQQMNEDCIFHCPTQLEPNQESSNAHKKKSKKRKKLLEVEEIDLTNSCWEHLVADKGSNKKRKTKSDNFDKECTDGMARDLSLTESSNLEIGSKECNLDSCVYEESLVRKKQKSERNSEAKILNVSYRNANGDDINNETISQPMDIKMPHKSSKSGINCQTEIITDSTEVKGDILVNSTNSKLDCSNSIEVNQSPVLNSTRISNCAEDNGGCNKIDDCSEDMSLESFGDFPKMKRKRVRKHNKKKKKERQELLSAVGPVLNRIIGTPKRETTLTSMSSELAKHVFFTEDDFIEEMRIPETPPNRSKTNLTGDSENENLSQGVMTLNTSRPEDTNWQQYLMSLKSDTSKPLVFRRSATPTVLGKNESLSKSPINTVPSRPTTEKYQENTNMSNNDVKEKNLSRDVTICNRDQTNLINAKEDLKSKVEITDIDSRDVTICNRGQTNLINSKEDLKSKVEITNIDSRGVTICNRDQTNLINAKEDLKSKVEISNIHWIGLDPKETKPDLNSIILTKYPIIEKVVPEDVILFKGCKVCQTRRDIRKGYFWRLGAQTWRKL